MWLDPFSHLHSRFTTYFCFPHVNNQPTAGPSQSNDNFAVIFQATENEYETVTGKPLRDHPFATQFSSCDNPQAVLGVLQGQSETFGKLRRRDERLMALLDPIVHILFTFSATLGEGVGLVGRFIRLV
jgi:hypothetical protein